MNDDRISEVYKGEIWSDEAQERARRRINWLCRQVTGDRVLDIGTSQGIVAILLGREGFEVVGVDIQPDRIEYAQADLAEEPETVQQRVQFRVGEGADLDVPDESFDAVVLGEVIEHLARPERVLEEAARVLRPGGRIAITTPFGVLHHHDHKQTFYPDDVLELVSGSFGVVSAEVGDRYFRIVGEKGAASADGIHDTLRASAFEAVRGIQEELAATRIERNRLVAATTRLEGVGEKLQQEKAARAELQRDAATLRRKLEQGASSGELARLEGRLRSANREVVRLRDRVDLWRHRTEVATWKLASLQQRRWWRLGSLLGEVRRRPASILALPAKLLHLASQRPPRLPRPRSPRVASAASSSPSSDDGPAGAAAGPPVAPRRDVPVAAVVTRRTAELLDREVLLWPLDQQDWSATLAGSRPSMLVVEDAARADWDAAELSAVEDAARRAGVPVVPVDPAGSGATVHPRLHNPVRGRQRREGVATVDPAARTIDGEHVDGEEAFVAAARRHEVLVVEGRHPPAMLAPLAATSTPLVVDDPTGAFGMHGDDHESRTSLTRALARSEVLGARHAHAAMRRAVRGHDVGRLLVPGHEPTPTVDVMVATNREHRLEDLLDNLGRQTYPAARLFLVCHGISHDRSRVADLAAERGVDLAGVWTEPQDVVLGEVFNRGFARTDAALVAKMDDDDLYGPEYLWDLVSAKDASGAEVAGKWAHYVYLEGPDAMVYRFRNHEHRYVEVVAISTLLMDRTVFDDDGFPPMPYGSGSVFLRSLGAAGARVYAADRWNYVYVRGADGGRNTFPVSDVRMLSNSDVVCAGLSLPEVIA